MKNSKRKAQEKREHAKKMELQHEAKLLKNEQRLKHLKGGFALHGIERPQETTRKTYSPKKVEYRNYQGLLPASPDPVHVDKVKPKYDEDMLAREARAQAEIHEKKKLSMPLYNKGGLMYPTPSEIEAMKNGELRRRS